MAESRAYDRVIIRRWQKSEGGDLIAILPDQAANPGRVMSYMHIGQHGEADYNVILARTKLVRSAEEAEELMSELRSIGYNPLRMERFCRNGRKG